MASTNASQFRLLFPTILTISPEKPTPRDIALGIRCCGSALADNPRAARRKLIIRNIPSPRECDGEQLIYDL